MIQLKNELWGGHHGDWQPPSNLTRIEILLGRSDIRVDEEHCPFCGLRGGALRAVLYLHTTTGVRGTGAHPGLLCDAHVACVPEEWLAKEYPATGLDTERCEAICSECAAHGPAEEYEEYEDGRPNGDACWSCVQMAAETETDYDEGEG